MTGRHREMHLVLAVIFVLTTTQSANANFGKWTNGATKGAPGLMRGVGTITRGIGNLFNRTEDKSKCYGTENTTCGHYVWKTKWSQDIWWKWCKCNRELVCHPRYRRCLNMTKSTEMPTNSCTNATLTATTARFNESISTTPAFQTANKTATPQPTTNTTTVCQLDCQTLKNTEVCSDMSKIHQFSTDPNVENYYNKYCMC